MRRRSWTRNVGRLGVAACVAGALLVVPLNNKPTQASPSVCGTSFDPYKAPTSTLVACGFQLFPREATVSLPGGGTEYDYMVGGDKTAYRIPPTGFNPLTASTAQLRFYDLPARPATGQPLADWEQKMTSVKFAVPPLELAAVPGVTAAASRANALSGGANSSNWAGESDVDETYYMADGTFNQPWYGSPQNCTAESEVTWSGLGGVYTQDLAQDGTNLQTPGLAQLQGWTEVLPDEPYVVAQPIYGRPGYAFEASVQRVNQGMQNPYFGFFMEDSYSHTVVAPLVYTNSFDGSTAEFIVERPSVNGSPSALVNFAYATFTRAEVSDIQNGPLYSLGSFYYVSFTMGPGTVHQQLAHPGSVYNGGNSFNVYFDNCE